MERRRFQRLKTRIPLFGRAEISGDAVEGNVMNVGEGGFSFDSPRELPLMARYGFELVTPAGMTPAVKLQVRGQVRWCAPSQDDGHRLWIGVMFELDSDAKRDEVRRFVAEHTLPEG